MPTISLLPALIVLLIALPVLWLLGVRFGARRAGEILGKMIRERLGSLRGSPLPPWIDKDGRLLKQVRPRMRI